ncbi:DUF3592 domain-containing protein [Ottowia sp.]|uniref:DUF3592 domain-containing protein n=1 Tax=Ottowia sp. TaxID=1898956 RepID=UPI002B8B4835|nr:DUF3592 domain-containing protein [Ottowia sp.]
MQLDVNGHAVTRVNASAIRRALGDRPASSDWSVTLEQPGGDFLQAFARSGEHFSLTARVGQQFYDGLEPLRADDAEAVLTAYLQEDERWRDAIAWRAPTSGAGNVGDLTTAALEQWRLDRQGKALSLAPGEISPMALLAVMGVLLAVGYALFHLDGLTRSLRFLPWPFDTDFGRVVAIVTAALELLFLLGYLGKRRALQRAAAWRAVPGRIVHSELGASASASDIDNPLYDQLPRISYEFEWEGRMLRGSRIGFDPADSGGANATRTIDRYPMGRAVTVYVNPHNTADTVLERAAPEGVASEVGKLALGLLVLATALAAAVRGLGGWVETHPHWLANAREPRLAALAGFMGFGALLIVLVASIRARRAAAWPQAAGEITFSGVRQRGALMPTTNSGRSNQVTMYEPHVEYAYTVGGHRYLGQQLALGGEKWAGNRASAEARAAAYPKGRAVAVRYNPANPGEAFIAPGSKLIAAGITTFGLAAIAFAGYQAGLW